MRRNEREEWRESKEIWKRGKDKWYNINLSIATENWERIFA